MEPRRVWILNLDAEEELARPDGYAPTRAMQRIVRRRSRRARALFAPGDLELGEADVDPAAFEGRAWCPTPWALARLREAGLRPEPAPALAILQRANARAFSFGLGSSLDAARLVTSVGEVAEALREERGPWIAKRALAAAGRGKRRLEAELGEADEAWIAEALADGPLLVEPFARIEAEFGLHGRWSADGVLTRGRICLQACDARGAWRSTEVARGGELSQAEQRELDLAFERTAAGLRALGYFGPFGIDAWRGTWKGRTGFQALSEVNARHSMGFAVGFGMLERLEA